MDMSKHQNLVNCKCGALVNRDTRWYYGHYDKGTADTFNVRGIIPEGHCPICRRKFPIHGSEEENK